MVNKNIAHNVISFKHLSDGVAELTVRINKLYQLKCVQVYLPTTSYPDEEIEKIYEEFDNIIVNSKAHYNIVMGDFNAKVGPGEIRKTCTGSYGIGTRNRRGDMLVEFAERHKLKIMNTFFNKRLNRRWTWISPNGAMKNEIDYIMQCFKNWERDRAHVPSRTQTGFQERCLSRAMTMLSGNFSHTLYVFHIFKYLRHTWTFIWQSRKIGRKICPMQ